MLLDNRTHKQFWKQVWEEVVISGKSERRKNHNIKVDISAFERVVQFIYLGINYKINYKNSIQEEIKSGLKSGNACYRSVQNLLSFILLSINVKIKIYRTIILSVVLYGCETWSLTLRENVG
jgi:hypothetical protein